MDLRLQMESIRRTPSGANLFPVAQGFLHDVGQFLPSDWLVQAGRTSLHGHPWPAMAWAVMIGWTMLLVAIAVVAYRRDSGRHSRR